MACLHSFRIFIFKITLQLISDLFLVFFFFYYSILMINWIDMFSKIRKMLPYIYIHYIYKSKAK